MLESIFEQCALLSGLVSESELISAWRKLGKNAVPAEEVPRRLSEILIEQKTLNRWQSQQLLAGRTRFVLGSYRIFDSIGRGGMGQVFKAKHEVMDTTAAIKVLPLEKSTPQAVESFQNEIQSLASLNHPNLVQAIDAGMDGNVYYLVTEYVAGPDLRKLVRTYGALTEESAACVIVQAARGLLHAHKAGLVHRDVKPGNILTTLRGVAKLSDMGLASSAINTNPSKKAKIVGTADYISPDQVRFPAEPKPVWDIYSLGCTLYYIVTGKVPYPGGTASEKVRAHIDENLQPLDPCRLNPLLSRDFVDVIGDMMAKNPDDRIPSAEEVIRRLSSWSDGDPTPIMVRDETFGEPVEVEPIERERQAFPSIWSNWTFNPSRAGVYRTETEVPSFALPPCIEGGANSVTPVMQKVEDLRHAVPEFSAWESPAFDIDDEPNEGDQKRAPRKLTVNDFLSDSDLPDELDDEEIVTAQPITHPRLHRVPSHAPHGEHALPNKAQGNASKTSNKVGSETETKAETKTGTKTEGEQPGYKMPYSQDIPSPPLPGRSVTKWNDTISEPPAQASDSGGLSPEDESDLPFSEYGRNLLARMKGYLRLWRRKDTLDGDASEE
ncbi:MAG: serine/threonine-protein kinase [Planctomycetia bacterium]|nr:serine/threonine-protein kinase [Planctomycetia bacterium]